MTDTHTSAAKRILVLHSPGHTEHTPKVAALLIPQFTINTFGCQIYLQFENCYDFQKAKVRNPKFSFLLSLIQYNTQSSCAPSVSSFCFWNHLWDLCFFTEVQ